MHRLLFVKVILFTLSNGWCEVACSEREREFILPIKAYPTNNTINNNNKLNTQKIHYVCNGRVHRKTVKLPSQDTPVRFKNRWAIKSRNRVVISKTIGFKDIINI